ncbi:flavodoxin family protein [Desulfopila aestuarii]|uniref:Multimeric flavodoxin WrbA n=1 Tax=Desulfopila aestuarii DSM 18488 TaxID=1121416 RepID=A0A1M7Y6S1_9BACT|nr:flavodoxin family protein [Desulfopila aestuarii]SHO48332.1 Multimeric flavodoxin WrbA [Desulfopila aestuarii DSM 18488]
MYAVAINGSPRKGGNTEILLKNVLQPLELAGWQTELVQVGGKNIRGCLACGKCREKQNMQCVVDNDIFNETMAKMVKADAIILGSPTYFADVSAELKALLDRSGYVALSNNRAFRGKIGSAVVAMRRAGAVHVFDTINHMFQINQMIIPGSSYWNLGIGRDKGEVEGDAEGLRNMKNLGETIAWLGAAIEPHKATFPEVAL